jgi:hypothetical protein
MHTIVTVRIDGNQAAALGTFMLFNCNLVLSMNIRNFILFQNQSGEGVFIASMILRLV